jgi:hypothetical protein
MKSTALVFLFMLCAFAAAPASAAPMSCQQWMAYRTGDRNQAVLGLAMRSFLQGYIDGVNEFADAFNGNLISETRPGKFEPTPPSQPVTIEETVAFLDRACTEDRAQSAGVLGVQYLQKAMKGRAAPIMDSMLTLLKNLNQAKGYK